jgi:putative phage-type endonuclease
MLDPNRKNYITASNVGAILGLGKYKKPNAVLNDMVKAFRGQLEYKDNPAFQHGRDNEYKGVQYANEFMKFIATGASQMFVTKGFLGATPDGISEDGSVVLEIKAPFKQDYSAHNYELYMPEYYAQMQVQMYCTGAQRALFVVVGSDEQISHIFVPFNDAWMKKHLPTLKEFYDSFRKIVDTDADLDNPDAKRLCELNKQIKQLQAEYDQVRDALLAENPNGGTFGNVSVSIIEKKGTVDYKKIVSEFAPQVDAEAYRGKSSKYAKVTFNDE